MIIEVFHNAVVVVEQGGNYLLEQEMSYPYQQEFFCFKKKIKEFCFHK